MTKKVFIKISLCCFVLFFVSCNSSKETAKLVINLQKCEFKLDNVVDFKVAGIDISKIKSVKDISLSDAAKLAQTFNNKKVPTTFTLNVAALNPNNGSNGTTQSTVTLQKLDWSLLVDGVQVTTGAVNQAIEIPSSAGQKIIIPLEMGLDLYEFFENKDYNSLINVAAAVGGPTLIRLLPGLVSLIPGIGTVAGIAIDLALTAFGDVDDSVSKLTLNAKPTISTPFGPIEYKNEIQVIEKEFRGK
jgi:hypothetical protein